MTIKQLAFDAQQHLQAETGTPFKRTHVFELLAAALGFNSYASLRASHVFEQAGLTIRHPADFIEETGRRCLDLGYAPEIALQVSGVLPRHMTQRDIGVVCISELVSYLRGDSGITSFDDNELVEGIDDEIDDDEDDDSHRWDDIDSLDCPILLEGLAAAGESGNASAHFALALLHVPEDDLDDQSAGSEYWYNEEQKGRVLAGAEKEWADAYAVTLGRAQKYERHLRAAGALGHSGALLKLAADFDDPTFFDRAPHPTPDVAPSLAAELAESYGRPADAHRWRTIAAEQGDTEAMRELIEGYDRADPLRCWTWIYLAEKLGVDLAKDEYRAIHDDGSDYDDDVGGTVFVDGRDGVRLMPIAPDQQAAAQLAATELFEKHSHAHRPG